MSGVSFRSVSYTHLDVYKRQVLECVPRIVRRILRLKCAGFGIASLAVEINAVASGVAEHAVKQNTDAELPGCTAERAEVLRIPEQRVNVCIIRRVVAVIGMRFKNGVEVHTRYAEALEVRQLLLDSPQIASEIIGRGV